MLGHVFVINLSDRKDRWKQICETWQNTFSLHRVEAKTGENPIQGCILSHVAMVKWAKEMKLPYIIVWEDDVHPLGGTAQSIYKRWCKFEKELQTCPDWKIISGGTGWSGLQATKIVHPQISEKLIEIPSGWFTHWMCYSSRMYDELIADLEKGITLPYDRYIYPRFQPWVTLPFFATQSESWSSIDQTNRSRTRGLKWSQFRLHVKYLFSREIRYYASSVQSLKKRPCPCLSIPKK